MYPPHPAPQLLLTKQSEPNALRKQQFDLAAAGVTQQHLYLSFSGISSTFPKPGVGTGQFMCDDWAMRGSGTGMSP